VFKKFGTKCPVIGRIFWGDGTPREVDGDCVVESGYIPTARGSTDEALLGED
jgi:hypothetical protein